MIRVTVPTSIGLDVLERIPPESPRHPNYKGSASVWEVRCKFCSRVYLAQRSAIRLARGCIACLHQRRKT